MALRVTDVVNAEWCKGRRDRNVKANRCINENKAMTHGPPVPGHKRCQACVDVHKRSR